MDKKSDPKLTDASHLMVPTCISVFGWTQKKNGKRPIPFISSLGSWHRSPLVSRVPRVSSIQPFLDPHVTVSQLTGDIFKLFSHAMKLLLGAAARPDAVWVSSPTCIELGPGDCVSLMGIPTPGCLQKQMCWHLRIPTWEELCANQ